MSLGPDVPLAHSAPHPGKPTDPYSRHVLGVQEGAKERAVAALRYATTPRAGFLESIGAAASFHDLGKLDPGNQAALRKGRGGRLEWDHIDAGVAHLGSKESWMAAWLVRAHHAPGLPEKEQHFNPDGIGRRLRGRRRTTSHFQDHDRQIARTDAYLQKYLADHDSAVGHRDVGRCPPVHGLTMRLALSCLVDADHTDTAFFDTGYFPPDAPPPRWAERLERLCAYVHDLPPGTSDAERARNRQRTDFFDACLHSPIDEALVACEGPVGLGKTTAVSAYLIRRARDEGLRHLIIVAPYTNILTQTAERLRKALILPGEQPDHVVVEHHHRADFNCPEDRDLAVLWKAPVILTTAVSFFETLAACGPGALRKLHELPGSAIFIDEAHAALPIKLWPQNWRWVCNLAEHWSCRFVFASGSLARFWEEGEIVPEPRRLPELLPPQQALDVMGAERSRIRYAKLADGRVQTVSQLIEHVRAMPGPRLVILNTVQSAGLVARALKRARGSVMHLSTALTPTDRAHILGKIAVRLAGSDKDWSLVATSCVEAGVDFSFRCAFRERFSVASTLQVGGRVNRHGEYNADGGGIVYDFSLVGEGITAHPGAADSANVLLRFMAEDELNNGDPAQVVTRAMREELRDRGGLGTDMLMKAEASRDYPKVSLYGHVIEADTRVVVVDQKLKDRLMGFEPVPFRDLLNGSVQLWATKIDKLGLELLPGRTELFVWNGAYDGEFLGIMEGLLPTIDFLNNRVAVI